MSKEVGGSGQQTLTIQQALDAGRQHHIAGRLAEAENFYNQILQAEPNHPKAMHLLGVVAYHSGKSGMAVDLISKALAIMPDYAAAHGNLGLALQKLGRLDEAVASYEQAIAMAPDYADAHNHLGNTLRELDRFDEALASYYKVLAINPEHTDAHFNLGSAFHKMGRLDEAVASYRKAIEFKPDYAEAHSNLGNTLQNFGRLEEAEESCRNALKLKPTSSGFLYNLAICITYLHKSDEATHQLMKLLLEKNDNSVIELRLPLAIHKFLTGDLTGSQQLASSHSMDLSKREKLELNNGKNYWGHLGFLLKWHKEKYLDGMITPYENTLYVNGESHALTSHGINISNSKGNFFCQSEWIWGCKLRWSHITGQFGREVKVYSKF